MEYNINEIKNILSGAEKVLTPDCVFCSHNNKLFIDNINLPKNWIYTSGITKLVLIPEKSDYVIKIPYKGDYSGYEFDAANRIQGHEWDYCLTENMIYYLAKKYRLNKFFAKTKPILKINNYQIYAQERVEQHPPFVSSRKEREEMYELCWQKEIDFVSAALIYWLISVKRYYGKEEMLSLLYFLKKYKIEDLHKGNYGWKSGAPVLLDYSGFND